ncbi:MAG: type I secretion C-terminal target domain-containing protein, partial [Pseudomonadota bacterium]
DVMLADSGNDTLDGGAGFDTLFGGSGSDTFVFSGNWRRDTVADWTDGEDTLDLSALGLKGAGESDADAFAKLTLVQDGATAIISVTGDTRNDIRLSNTEVSTLDAGDFLFETPPAAAPRRESGPIDPFGADITTQQTDPTPWINTWDFEAG